MIPLEFRITTSYCARNINSGTYKLLLFVTDADGPVPLELPNQWLWDIIDEFIYQVLYKAPLKAPNKAYRFALDNDYKTKQR